MVVELKDENFSSVTSNSQKPVLVDCWAAWCGPCRMQSPIIDELDTELSEKVIFAKLNVDDNMQTATALGIVSIPTLLVYKDGKIVEKLVGLSSKEELSETLIKYI